jgi:ABC-type transport system substrate-binding protein
MPAQAAKDQEVKLAQQAAQLIVKQDVADIPLYWSNAFLISNKRVKGLVLSPLGWQSLLMNSYTTVTVDDSGA